MSIGFDGWGKRLAVMAFLLLVWLSPTVHAAAAGVLVPFPDKELDRSRHKRPLLPEKMPFPGTISTSPVVPMQVHPIYPHDGAIFPPNAAVTVSWRMPDKQAHPDTLRQDPRYFQVELTSHTQPVTVTMRYIPYSDKKPTFHGIFSNLPPGIHVWQVTAVMEDRSIMKSPALYFVVKEPNYFTVEKFSGSRQEAYPHYYYDSQDHIRAGW